MIVPTFHGMALRVSVLGNTNFGEQTLERLTAVGFEVAQDVSLQQIQQAPESRFVVGYTAQGPRVSMTLAFDPVAQATQTTLDLLDRPL